MGKRGQAAGGVEGVAALRHQLRAGQVGVAGDRLPLAGRIASKIDPLFGDRVAGDVPRLLDPRRLAHPVAPRFGCPAVGISTAAADFATFHAQTTP